MRKIIDWTHQYCRREIAVVAAILLAASGALCFIEIAENVSERDTQPFDEWVLRSLRRPGDPSLLAGPDWVATAARDVSALGSLSVLALATLGAAGFVFLSKKHHAMALLLTAVIGGALWTSVLKYYFGRPRPTLVPHLEVVTTPSFPSGHSMLSAVVYLTVGVLLARELKRTRQKVYVFAFASLLAVLVGISRAMLGVHYPTDIMAGWAGGVAWALPCWIAVRYLQRNSSDAPGRRISRSANMPVEERNNA